jgi:hypothetical protein
MLRRDREATPGCLIAASVTFVSSVTFTLATLVICLIRALS